MIKSYVYLLVAVGELGNRMNRRREDGFTTAELLGNAALGVAAVVAIWAVLQKAGITLVQDMIDKVTSGASGK